MKKILFNLLVASVFLGTIHEASAGKHLEVKDERNWKASPKASLQKNQTMAERGWIPMAPVKKKTPLYKSLHQKTDVVAGTDGNLWRKAKQEFPPVLQPRITAKPMVKITIENGCVKSVPGIKVTDFIKINVPQPIKQIAQPSQFAIPKIIVTCEG